jgi:hypothetical protein
MLPSASSVSSSPNPAFACDAARQSRNPHAQDCHRRVMVVFSGKQTILQRFSRSLSLSLSPLLGEPFHPSRLFLQSHILLLLVHYFYENIFSKEQAGAMMDTEKLAVGVVKRQSGNNHAVITPNLLSLNLRDEPTTC